MAQGRDRGRVSAHRFGNACLYPRAENELELRNRTAHRDGVRSCERRLQMRRDGGAGRAGPCVLRLAGIGLRVDDRLVALWSAKRRALDALSDATRWIQS